MSALKVGVSPSCGNWCAIRWALGLALILFAGFVAAQADAPTAARTIETLASPPLEKSETPLVVFNRTVAVLRAPFLGISADDRARRTKQNIEEILGRGGPGDVTIQSAPQGRLVLVDGELAVILTPDDVDRLRGETLDGTAKAAAAALTRVISETREGRDRKQFLHSLLLAGAGTLIYFLAVGLIFRVRTWLMSGPVAALKNRTVEVKLIGLRLLQPERLYAMARALVWMLSWLLLALLTYSWVSYVLNQFPYTRPWGEQLAGSLLGVLGTIGSGVLTAMPGLMVAVTIFLLARGVTGLAAPMFDRVAERRSVFSWLDADTVGPTRRMFSVAVWLFALVMAYPYLPGAQSEAFKGMSVLLGLMVTVGGSSLFGQAASGMILMYSRTLRLGEYVRIGEHEGTVTELGTFTTRIRTGLGEELTLPNALVLGAATKNYSRAVKGPGYVVDTTVTIGYDTPWRQVHAMLIEAAGRTPGVLSDPQPRVFQTALSDFYPEYRLVCQAIQAEPRSRAEVLGALHANIQDVFNEYGVQIMSPHYLGDPATAKLVARDQWFAPPAAPSADKR